MSVLGNHLKNKNMNKKNERPTLSLTLALMAILFNVCLIASNLFETKVFTLGNLTLTGGFIIFPISYILNDCIVEVWGFKKARLVIWTGFAMNFFVVAMAQIVRVLPPAPFWDGGEHFDFIFAMAPRVTIASLLAFLAGSTLNAWVMSRMKVASKGKRFSLRAIVSSLVGETIDSLIFFPIAFGVIGLAEMVKLMVIQVILKTSYEVVILPITQWVVKKVKAYEQIEHFDQNISYNPFKIRDI